MQQGFVWAPFRRESLSAAVILLRRAQDPVIAKLDAAPYDDEEASEEDLR